MEINEELGDRRGVAMVLNSLGGARRDRGELEEAIAAFERSLQIQAEAEIDVGRDSIRSNRGTLRQWRRRENAVTTAAERQAIMVQYQLQMGGIRHGHSDFPGAVVHYSRALAMTGDPSSLARCHSGLGLANFRLRKNDLAPTYVLTFPYLQLLAAPKAWPMPTETQ